MYATLPSNDKHLWHSISQIHVNLSFPFYFCFIVFITNDYSDVVNSECVLKTNRKLFWTHVLNKQNQHSNEREKKTRKTMT